MAIITFPGDEYWVAPRWAFARLARSASMFVHDARDLELLENIQAMGAKVRLHICGNTRFCLADMGRLSCEIVDLDSLSPLAEARKQMGPAQVLLGNLNPVAVLRNGTPGTVTQAIAECHHDAGPRFIVGAGCEVPRDTPEANLRALSQYAHSHAP